MGADRSRVRNFEELLRADWHPGMQEMYLALLRAWTALHFMRVVTAAELAEQMVKEGGCGDDRERERQRHERTAGNVTLLAGMIEMGLVSPAHNEFDVRTYRLTFEGHRFVERVRDVIEASKDRPATDWFPEF